MDEGLGDGVSTANVEGGEHVHCKENEYSVRAPESANMMESPELGTLGERSFPESSFHLFEEVLDAAADASKQPCASPRYMDDAGNMVEELMVRNYDSSSLAIVGTSNNRERIQSRHGHWQHLYRLRGGSASGSSQSNNFYRDNGEPMPIAQEENMPCKPLPEFLGGNVLSDDQNDAVEELENVGYKGLSGNMITQGGIKTKVLSKSGFSEFFVKNTLMGKGIILRGSPHIGMRVEPRDQNNGKAIGDTSMAPSALPSLGVNYTIPSSFGIMSGTDHGNFDHEGTSVRDILKIGQCERNKVESLHIFKQIVELLDQFHSQGITLHDLRPSRFKLLRSNQFKYIGLTVQRDLLERDIGQGTSYSEIHATRRRPVEPGVFSSAGILAKKQKLSENNNFSRRWPLVTSKYGVLEAANDGDTSSFLDHNEHKSRNKENGSFGLSRKQYHRTSKEQSTSISDQLEKKWYTSPEELSEGICTASSNIYSMGVLLFELLGRFDSERARDTAMTDMRHRILPPFFLSENPKEAGFCLWLLHPEPSSRPATREILQSEVITGLQQVSAEKLSSSIEQDDAQSDLLLHFLVSLKELKENHASKLAEDIRCLESDIIEVESRSCSKEPRLDTLSHLSPSYTRNEGRLINNISQLESAYFSMRSRVQHPEMDASMRQDKDILRNRDNWHLTGERIEDELCADRVGAFFDGLCKYARYSKFKVRGLLRTGDFSNSANVICSLSFDRDMDYFAAAGVSKKIKIFELDALFNDSVDIHYPVTEMSNKSKLSCICWNSYIKNYLASTDYDGIVKLWDASTGQEIFQYKEHEKRAWSVDFSQVYPTKLASGSDDCSVKLWSMNEKSSLGTIRNMANVCCVQFSSHSTHLLAFGSADYKTYCYDLRNVRSPWCILSGHNKAVSYVKFLDPETLVTASTDNSLKLWDLNKTNSSGLSTSACSLTLSGHTNEKNFVGLSVADGYIACGSETNEVYTYYRSLPMPITSHKFGSIDPISGKETDDDNGQFVSSVCWRGNSDLMIASNSSGCIKVLQMV